MHVFLFWKIFFFRNDFAVAVMKMVSFSVLPPETLRVFGRSVQCWQLLPR